MLIKDAYKKIFFNFLLIYLLIYKQYHMYMPFLKTFNVINKRLYHWTLESKKLKAHFKKPSYQSIMFFFLNILIKL